MEPSGIELMMNERFDTATQIRLALQSLGLEDIDPVAEAESGEHSDQIMRWMNDHSVNFRGFLGSCEPAELHTWESEGKEGLRKLAQAFMAYEREHPLESGSELLH